MGFGNAIRIGFSKFAVWQGRASRSEFWFFHLFAFLCYVIAAILDTGIGGGAFNAIALLILFLPSLSVTVRRLHDTDRSGWFYWLALIPIIGAIVLLIWFCSRGTLGENMYGPDPTNGFDGNLGASPSVAMGDLDRLERLAELHSKGVFSDEEYGSQKAGILQKS